MSSLIKNLNVTSDIENALGLRKKMIGNVLLSDSKAKLIKRLIDNPKKNIYGWFNPVLGGLIKDYYIKDFLNKQKDLSDNKKVLAKIEGKIDKFTSKLVKIKEKITNLNDNRDILLSLYYSKDYKDIIKSDDYKSSINFLKKQSKNKGKFRGVDVKSVNHEIMDIYKVDLLERIRDLFLKINQMNNEFEKYERIIQKLFKEKYSHKLNIEELEEDFENILSEIENNNKSINDIVSKVKGISDKKIRMSLNNELKAMVNYESWLKKFSDKIKLRIKSEKNKESQKDLKSEKVNNALTGNSGRDKINTIPTYIILDNDSFYFGFGLTSVKTKKDLDDLFIVGFNSMINKMDRSVNGKSKNIDRKINPDVTIELGNASLDGMKNTFNKTDDKIVFTDEDGNNLTYNIDNIGELEIYKLSFSGTVKKKEIVKNEIIGIDNSNRRFIRRDNETKTQKEAKNKVSQQILDVIRNKGKESDDIDSIQKKELLKSLKNNPDGIDIKKELGISDKELRLSSIMKRNIGIYDKDVIFNLFKKSSPSKVNNDGVKKDYINDYKEFQGSYMYKNRVDYINKIKDFFEAQVYPHLDNVLGLILFLRLMVELVIFFRTVNKGKKVSKSFIKKSIKMIIEVLYEDKSDITSKAYLSLVSSMFKDVISGDLSIVKEDSIFKKFKYFIYEKASALEDDMMYRWDCENFKTRNTRSICIAIDDILDIVVGEEVKYRYTTRTKFKNNDEIEDEANDNPEVVYLREDEIETIEQPVEIQSNLIESLMTYINENKIKINYIFSDLFELKGFSGFSQIKKILNMILNQLNIIFKNEAYGREVLKKSLKELSLKGFLKSDELKDSIYNYFEDVFNDKAKLSARKGNENITDYILSDIFDMVSFISVLMNDDKINNKFNGGENPKIVFPYNSSEILYNYLLNFVNEIYARKERLKKESKYSSPDIENSIVDDLELLANNYSRVGKNTEYNVRIVAKDNNLRGGEELISRILLKTFSKYEGEEGKLLNRINSKTGDNFNFIKDSKIHKGKLINVSSKYENLPMSIRRVITYFEKNIVEFPNILRLIALYRELELVNQIINDDINNIVSKSQFNRTDAEKKIKDEIVTYFGSLSVEREAALFEGETVSETFTRLLNINDKTTIEIIQDEASKFFMQGISNYFEDFDDTLLNGYSDIFKNGIIGKSNKNNKRISYFKDTVMNELTSIIHDKDMANSIDMINNFILAGKTELAELKDANIFIDKIGELSKRFKDWNFSRMMGNLYSLDDISSNVKSQYKRIFAKKPNVGSFFEQIAPEVYNIAKFGLLQQKRQIEDKVLYSIIQSFGVKTLNKVDDRDDGIEVININVPENDIMNELSKNNFILMEGEKNDGKNALIESIKARYEVSSISDISMTQKDLDELYLNAIGFGKRDTIGNVTKIKYMERRGIYLTPINDTTSKEDDLIKINIMDIMKTVLIADLIIKNAGRINETTSQVRKTIRHEKESYVFRFANKTIFDSWLLTLSEEDRDLVVKRLDLPEYPAGDLKSQSLDILANDMINKSTRQYIDFYFSRMEDKTPGGFYDILLKIIVDPVVRYEDLSIYFLDLMNTNKIDISVIDFIKKELVKQDTLGITDKNTLNKIYTLYLAFSDDFDIIPDDFQFWYPILTINLDFSLLLKHDKLLNKLMIFFKSNVFDFFDIYQEVDIRVFNIHLFSGRNELNDIIKAYYAGRTIGNEITKISNYFHYLKDLIFELNSDENLSEKKISYFQKGITVNTSIAIKSLFNQNIEQYFDDIKDLIKTLIGQLKTDSFNIINKKINLDVSVLVKNILEEIQEQYIFVEGEDEPVYLSLKDEYVNVYKMINDYFNISSSFDKVIDSFYLEDEDLEMDVPNEDLIRIYESFAVFLEDYYSSSLTQVFTAKDTKNNNKEQSTIYSVATYVDTLSTGYKKVIDGKITEAKVQGLSFVESINFTVEELLKIALEKLKNIQPELGNYSDIAISFDAMKEDGNMSFYSRFINTDSIYDGIFDYLVMLEKAKKSETNTSIGYDGLLKGIGAVASKVLPKEIERKSLLLIPSVSNNGLFTAEYGKSGIIITEVDGGKVTYLETDNNIMEKTIKSLSLKNDRDLLKTIFEVKKYKLAVKEGRKEAMFRGYDILVADGKKLAYSGNKNFKNVTGSYLDDSLIFGEYRTENLITHLKDGYIFKDINAGIYNYDDFIYKVSRTSSDKNKGLKRGAVGYGIKLNDKFKSIEWMDKDNKYRKRMLDVLYALSMMSNMKFLVSTKKTKEDRKYKEYFVINEKTKVNKNMLRSTDSLKLRVEKPYIYEAFQLIGIGDSTKINGKLFIKVLMELMDRDFIINEEEGLLNKETKEPVSENEMIIIDRLRQHIAMIKKSHTVYYNKQYDVLYYGLFPLNVAISEIISTRDWDEKVRQYWADNHITYDEYKTSQYEKELFIEKIKSEQFGYNASSENGENGENENIKLLLEMPFSSEDSDIKANIDVDDKVYAGYTDDDMNDVFSEDDDFFNERDHRGKMFGKYFVKKSFFADAPKEVKKSNISGMYLNFMSNLFLNLEIMKRNKQEYNINTLDDETDILSDLEDEKDKMIIKYRDKLLKSNRKIVSSNVKRNEKVSYSNNELQRLQDELESIERSSSIEKLNLEEEIKSKNKIIDNINNVSDIKNLSARELSDYKKTKKNIKRLKIYIDGLKSKINEVNNQKNKEIKNIKNKIKKINKVFLMEGAIDSEINDKIVELDKKIDNLNTKLNSSESNFFSKIDLEKEIKKTIDKKNQIASLNIDIDDVFNLKSKIDKQEKIILDLIVKIKKMIKNKESKVSLFDVDEELNKETKRKLHYQELLFNKVESIMSITGDIEKINSIIQIQKNKIMKIKNSQKYQEYKINNINDYNNYSDIFEELEGVYQVVWKENISSLMRDINNDIKIEKKLWEINNAFEEYEDDNKLSLDENFDVFLAGYDLGATIFNDLFKFYLKNKWEYKKNLTDDKLEKDYLEYLPNIWSRTSDEIIEELTVLLRNYDSKGNRYLRFSTLKYILLQNGINISKMEVKKDLSSIKKGQMIRVKALTYNLEKNEDGKVKRTANVKSTKDTPMIDYFNLLSFVNKETIPANVIISKNDIAGLASEVINYPEDIILKGIYELEKVIKLLMR